MKQQLVIIAVLLALLGIFVYHRRAVDEIPDPKGTFAFPPQRCVYYIDSYNQTYGHSRTILKTARQILLSAGVNIDVVHMDADNPMFHDSCKETVGGILETIEYMQPDLVIAADDPASKFVVAPHLKGAPIPVLFVGINWDATIYGFPCDNISGQVEMNPILQVVEHLRPYARGNRIGILSGDTVSSQRLLPYLSTRLDIDPNHAIYVRDFVTWKAAYQRLQKDVDLLLLETDQGINQWDLEAARHLVMTKTEIPTGGSARQLASLMLICLRNPSDEIGEYAGRMALEILNGQSINEIPVSTTTRTRIYLNMHIAKKLGIRFPMSLIERATFVSEGI